MGKNRKELNEMRKKQAKNEPLWKGPYEDGITFSMLNRFLACRHRFYTYVIEGLRPEPQFNHRIEFGNMWHLMEEGSIRWKGNALIQILVEYCKDLCEVYPSQQEEIDKWYNVVKVQWPIYLEYYDNPTQFSEEKDEESLSKEQVFKVPYQLPSGRVLWLRGKWDLVSLVTHKIDKWKGISVTDHKTKGEVDVETINRQLPWDLQTNLYLVALQTNPLVYLRGFDGSNPYCKETLRLLEEVNKNGLMGITYNVIRRPLSGGKGTIIRKKPSGSNPRGESKKDYYERLAEYIRQEPETYFYRWDVEVSQTDIYRFRRECLNPILEQVCDWWEWVNSIQSSADNLWSTKANHGIHWRHPFGCFNEVDEYGVTDIDHYLDTRDKVGLVKVDSLFRELE